MKKLLTLIVMWSVTSTQAATFGILQTDPISIIIQGSDSDAKRLYDSLNVVPTEQSNSLLEKKVESPSGQIAITCRHAQLAAVSSCTVTVRSGSNLKVSEESKRAYLQSYELNDTEFLYNKFIKDVSGRVPMFVTEKQEFAFFSDAEQFILSYQQINP